MRKQDVTSNQNRVVFDRKAVALRRRRAAATLAQHGFLFDEIGERLSERLHDVNRTFPKVLNLGARTAAFAEAVAARPGAEAVTSYGPTPLDAETIVGEEEALPFAPETFDLIVSNLALHWVNDLPGVLIQARQVLKPDGLFLAAMLGGDTLYELRQAFLEAEAAVENGASPRVSPFVDVRTAGGLLQRAGFALPLVDIDTVHVTYPDAFALMRELRGMGETNAHIGRRRTFTRRRTLMAMVEAYHTRFGTPDGRIPATFQVIYLTAWVPHDSQPKPLKPGSAKVSLKDVLGKSH